MIFSKQKAVAFFSFMLTLLFFNNNVVLSSVNQVSYNSIQYSISYLSKISKIINEHYGIICINNVYIPLQNDPFIETEKELLKIYLKIVTIDMLNDNFYLLIFSDDISILKTYISEMPKINKRVKNIDNKLLLVGSILPEKYNVDLILKALSNLRKNSKMIEIQKFLNFKKSFSNMKIFYKIEAFKVWCSFFFFKIDLYPFKANIFSYILTLSLTSYNICEKKSKILKIGVVLKKINCSISQTDSTHHNENFSTVLIIIKETNSIQALIMLSKLINKEMILLKDSLYILKCFLLNKEFQNELFIKYIRFTNISHFLKKCSKDIFKININEICNIYSNYKIYEVVIPLLNELISEASVIFKCGDTKLIETKLLFILLIFNAPIIHSVIEIKGKEYIKKQYIENALFKEYWIQNMFTSKIFKKEITNVIFNHISKNIPFNFTSYVKNHFDTSISYNFKKRYNMYNQENMIINTNFIYQKVVKILLYKLKNEIIELSKKMCIDLIQEICLLIIIILKFPSYGGYMYVTQDEYKLIYCYLNRIRNNNNRIIYKIIPSKILESKVKVFKEIFYYIYFDINDYFKSNKHEITEYYKKSLKNDLILYNFKLKVMVPLILNYNIKFQQWLYYLIKEIFDNNYLIFDNDEHFMSIIFCKNNFMNKKAYFKFLGRIIGLSIYKNVAIPLIFKDIVYNLLLNNKISDDEILDKFEKVRFDTIQIQKYAKVIIEYEILYNKMYTNKKIELCKNIKLNEDDIEKYKKFYLKKIKENLILIVKAIRSGVLNIINKNAFNNIKDICILKKLISGNRKINIENWKIKTIYVDGWKKKDNTIKWFWEFVEDCEEKDLIELLRSLKGSYKIQLKQFKNLFDCGFTIGRIGQEHGYYIIAEQNILNLKVYDSKDELHADLKKIIHFSRLRLSRALMKIDFQ
ncbi:E3 ubiquitin-protein ligase TOM1-like [Astathelohania contejeani]|uniref:HECT-type E3 ubiquitin transferase n=1 Tax=Astathelohania contejeani TaxID=164912 RepID=A0ABQ7HYT7_9MICR|nr:E3 ubiquitin-protein ligase TOM1-like [Thelohania contejeani]